MNKLISALLIGGVATLGNAKEPANEVNLAKDTKASISAALQQSQGNKDDSSIHFGDVEIINNTETNVDTTQQNSRDVIIAKKTENDKTFENIYTPLSKEENAKERSIKQTVTVEDIEFNIYINNDTVIIKSPEFNKIWEEYRDVLYAELIGNSFARAFGTITEAEYNERKHKFAENHLNKIIEELKQGILSDLKNGIIPNDNYQYFHDKIEKSLGIYFNGIHNKIAMIGIILLGFGRPFLLERSVKVFQGINKKTKLTKMLESKNGDLLGHVISVLSNKNTRDGIQSIAEDIENLKFPNDSPNTEFFNNYNEVKYSINNLLQILKNTQLTQNISNNSIELTKWRIEFNNMLKKYKALTDKYSNSVSEIKGTIQLSTEDKVESSINFNESLSNIINNDMSNSDIEYLENILDDKREFNSEVTRQKEMQALYDYLIKIQNLIEPILPQELAQEPTNSETE